MARKLPWERIAAPQRELNDTQSRSCSPAHAGPARRDGDVDDEDDRRKRRKSAASPPPGVSNSATRFRTPSTSPPPAPPSEAFMIEGLEHDDKYRMVEDELLAVAQTFTAHLHAAEYQRLKAKAKEHARATGGSGLLPRPTTRAPTDRVTKRNVMAERRAKQNKLLRKLDGHARDDDASDDSDADAPWAGTSLQSLMTRSTRKATPNLVSLGSFASKGTHTQERSEMHRIKYRPLSGSSPLKAVTAAYRPDEETASEVDEDEDEDDLDGPAHEEKSYGKRHFPSTNHAETPRTQPPRTVHTTSTTRTVSFAPEVTEKPPSHPVSAGRDDIQYGDVDDDDDDDNDLSDMDGGSLMDKIRRRREQEKIKRQQRRQQQRGALIG